MRYPLDLVHEELRWEDEETHVSRMMIEMKMAKKIIEARRRREKQKEEEKRPQFRPTEFDVGDTVFIFRPKDAQGAAGKLWLGYVGPYIVKEKLPGGVTYKIQKGEREIICNINNMIKLNEDKGVKKPKEIEEEEKRQNEKKHNQEEKEEEEEVDELEKDLEK